jgi:hypothetical protein
MVPKEMINVIIISRPYRDHTQVCTAAKIIGIVPIMKKENIRMKVIAFL